MTKQELEEIIEVGQGLQEIIEEREMVLTDSIGTEYNVVDVRDLELICEYYHQSKL
jgi:hypothetical protein